MAEFILYLFILSFLIQSFNFLFIFSRLAFYKEKTENKVIKGVSIVVAAHNERTNLERLIPLLLAQTHPDFEIIIANDRSSDGSSELISSFKDTRLKEVKIVSTPLEYNSKKYALTRAIEQANREIILLTDADCYPVSDNWVREMQSGFTQKKEIVLGYSPYEKKKGFLNLFIRYETFYTAIQYLSFALMGQAYMGVGRNLSYYKKMFERKDGFNKYRPVTGGDDDLLIGQMASNENTGIKITRESQVLSIPKTSYSAFFRQKLRHLGVGKHYKAYNRFKTGILPISQFTLYFSVIPLVFFNIYISWVLSIFILRTLLIIVIFALISRKLGETIKWLWFPLLDVCYLINYLVTGISALFSKNIKWT